jgi:hypothetical protein
MNDDMIANWSCFGINKLGISLVKYTLDDSDVYNAQITFFLDDAKEYKSIEDRKSISFLTDMVMSCPKCLAMTLVDMYSTMFSEATIAAIVSIFDSEGKHIESLNLNEDFDDHVSDSELDDEDLKIPENRTLH